MKTSELLDKINGETSDAELDNLYKEIEECIPFVDMYETLGGLQNSIDELTSENRKLKNLLNSHSHVDGKVMIEA